MGTAGLRTFASYAQSITIFNLEVVCFLFFLDIVFSRTIIQIFNFKFLFWSTDFLFRFNLLVWRCITTVFAGMVGMMTIMEYLWKNVVVLVTDFSCALIHIKNVLYQAGFCYLDKFINFCVNFYMHRTRLPQILSFEYKILSKSMKFEFSVRSFLSYNAKIFCKP